jgi:hypothetical protein
MRAKYSFTAEPLPPEITVAIGFAAAYCAVAILLVWLIVP